MVNSLFDSNSDQTNDLKILFTVFFHAQWRRTTIIFRWLVHLTLVVLLVKHLNGDVSSSNRSKTDETLIEAFAFRLEERLYCEPTLSQYFCVEKEPRHYKCVQNYHCWYNSKILNLVAQPPKILFNPLLPQSTCLVSPLVNQLWMQMLSTSK